MPVNPDSSDVSLFHLLRELAKRLDEGTIEHVNQTTQITITGEQGDADTLENLAREAGTDINMIKL